MCWVERYFSIFLSARAMGLLCMCSRAFSVLETELPRNSSLPLHSFCPTAVIPSLYFVACQPQALDLCQETEKQDF